MANWRKVALGAILSDGKIDEREVRIIKKEIFEDKKVTLAEANFLIELRNKATSLHSTFKELFFSALRQNVLKDGVINAKEANWLRKMVYADRRVDDDEKKFLRDLKAAARKMSPAFTKLHDDCAEAAPPA